MKYSVRRHVPALVPGACSDRNGGEEQQDRREKQAELLDAYEPVRSTVSTEGPGVEWGCMCAFGLGWAVGHGGKHRIGISVMEKKL